MLPMSRSTSRPGRRTPLPGAVLAVVLALSLAACSGEDPAEPPESSGPSEPSEPASTGPESYLPVPDDVTLTAPGTDLELGRPATVAVPLDDREVGVLRLRVDEVAEVTAQEFRGWLGPQALDESRPYFVQVRVTNAGDTQLGGHDVPLYLLDDNGTLGPPWAFDGRFRPCQSGPLPRRFAPGDRASTCLVYLAPMKATVESLAFVPTGDAEPITWTGKVDEPKGR